MTTDRDLLEQALDAFESGRATDRADVMKALRTRLSRWDLKMTPSGVTHIYSTGASVAQLGPSVWTNTAWKSVAVRLGEELSTVGPGGYYDMSHVKSAVHLL